MVLKGVWSGGEDERGWKIVEKGYENVEGIPVCLTRKNYV